MNNYDYPIGADNSDAPWNQSDKEEIEVEVCITQTLTKCCTIETNDYYVERGDDHPTINQDTLDEKFGACYHSIPEMITILKQYVERDLRNTKEGSKYYQYLQLLKDDCEGWELVETDVNMM